MLYMLFMLSEVLAALSPGSSVRAAGGRAPDTALEFGLFFVGCPWNNMRTQQVLAFWHECHTNARIVIDPFMILWRFSMLVLASFGIDLGSHFDSLWLHF